MWLSIRGTCRSRAGRPAPKGLLQRLHQQCAACRTTRAPTDASPRQRARGGPAPMWSSPPKRRAGKRKGPGGRRRATSSPQRTRDRGSNSRRFPHRRARRPCSLVARQHVDHVLIRLTACEQQGAAACWPLESQIILATVYVVIRSSAATVGVSSSATCPTTLTSSGVSTTIAGIEVNEFTVEKTASSRLRSISTTWRPRSHY